MSRTDASSGGQQQMAPTGVRGIWLVSSSGEKQRISSETMDAYAPSLSPDGSKIAFMGREFDESGKPSAGRLYVGHVSMGSFQSYVVQRAWSSFSDTSAAQWLDENRVSIVSDRGDRQVLRVVPDGDE
ncbi:hypothetical protein ACFQ5Q_19045 [Luteolibacter ambystomatis]